jgi:hypothetical protein
MTRRSICSMLLLGVAACAPQQGYQPVAAAPPPPAPPPPPAMPASAPGLGPSKNMGLNYDGRYAGVSAVSDSAGNTWSTGGSRPCVTEPAPTMTIVHGRASFKWQGFTLTGHLTPSGHLMMTSTFGQVFEGSINSQYQITGQVTGYCSYDLTFQKQS